MPLSVEKASANGSAMLSRVRLATRSPLKGGLKPKLSPFWSDSRSMNRPSPARTALLPLPATSQASPRRGARKLLVLVSERLGPGVPPRSPAAWQALEPGGSSIPLQGSPPREGLNVVGSKLEMVSPTSYGFSKRDQRTP